MKTSIISYRKVISCWIFFTIFNSFTLIQTIVVVPQNAISYQPPNIESSIFILEKGQIKFALTTENIVTANLGGGFYYGEHQILFERIHLNAIKNYKLTLSMSGLNYNTPTDVENDPALVTFHWINLNQTGFVLVVRIATISRFTFVNCRYLAVNDIEGTEFYFDSFYSVPMVPLSSSVPFNIYRPYLFTSPITNYNFFIIMRGINSVTTASNVLYILTAQIFDHDGTQCRIEIKGSYTFLKDIYFSIIYTKKILQSTDPYSKLFQTKILSIQNHGCGVGISGFGGCIAYNSNTFKPAFKIFDNNYFLGIFDFGAKMKHNYYIGINLGTLDVWLLAGGGVRQDGILFYTTLCPQGYFADLNIDQCIQCGKDCIKCDKTHCQTCKTNYFVDQDNINCLPLYSPPSIDGCAFYFEENGQFQCKLCDPIRKLSLISQTEVCGCRAFFFKNLTSNACQQICGDGIVFESQCDDKNTNDNDGCDRQCKLQPGFQCDVTQAPTQCNSTLELFYKIKSITKTQQNDPPSGIIVLRPVQNKLPFDVIKENFYTGNLKLSQIHLKLVMNQSSSEILMDLEFDLLKVENNEIWLIFDYNFTVEGMTAQIMLNYSETRYANKTQIFNFSLKGENQAFKISQLQAAYNTVSNNVIVTVALSMTGLVVGLSLPKFIGLEMIVTMQLIFYSQILIDDFDKWPVGFVQFEQLKVATGYNDFLNLTEFTPTTIVSKKYNKLTLPKTIIENFNLNFIILVVFTTFFYITVSLRSNHESKMKDFMRQNQIMKSGYNVQLNTMSKTHKKLTKVNNILYWVCSQLSLWCILPLLSALGAQFMIPNSNVQVNDNSLTFLLLKLRTSEFLVTFFIILSIGFNHFRNMLVSAKTEHKIKQRPEELLYKKLLFVYLTVMGLLIFFYNGVKFRNIPISVICLTVHTFYLILMIIIQPYKQALRIHSVTLYFNQFLYFVFLVFINLINLVNVIDDFLVLCFGYFVIGCVYLLILLSVVRLYYEIRYGEALENKIKAQKKKEQEEQKVRKQQKLKKNAELQLGEAQKVRDLNKFLIENQLKETEQINLLEWLEQKNWEKETKEKYFYRKYTEKPLQWMKKKDKTEYEKRVNAMKDSQKETVSKKLKKEDDTDYIELMKKMRENLQKQKSKNRTEKKMKKQKLKGLYENFEQ